MSRAFDRAGVRKIVIHHLGNKHNPIFTREELLRAANPDGWDYPNYDYGILATGEVVNMRPLSFIGAHTQADRTRYNYGPNWWNENSASVVIANDNQMFKPTAAQVEGLVKFLTGWLKVRGLDMGAAYPHFQVTQTDCPGGSYKKLALDTGYLDYDAVELDVTNALNGVVAGGVELMRLIVAYTKEDQTAAALLADAVHSAIILKDYFPVEEAAKIGTLYQVGGPNLYPGKAVLLSGVDRYATARAVLDFIAKGV